LCLFHKSSVVYSQQGSSRLLLISLFEGIWSARISTVLIANGLSAIICVLIARQNYDDLNKALSYLIPQAIILVITILRSRGRSSAGELAVAQFQRGSQPAPSEELRSGAKSQDPPLSEPPTVHGASRVMAYSISTITHRAKLSVAISVGGEAVGEGRRPNVAGRPRRRGAAELAMARWASPGPQRFVRQLVPTSGRVEPNECVTLGSVGNQGSWTLDCRVRNCRKVTKISY
jgi:hypothetical protein